jgi:hypothetical protein
MATMEAQIQILQALVAELTQQLDEVRQLPPIQDQLQRINYYKDLRVHMEAADELEKLEQAGQLTPEIMQKLREQGPKDPNDSVAALKFIKTLL